jgi:hypothetical protein
MTSTGSPPSLTVGESAVGQLCAVLIGKGTSGPVCGAHTVEVERPLNQKMEVCLSCVNSVPKT